MTTKAIRNAALLGAMLLNFVSGRAEAIEDSLRAMKVMESIGSRAVAYPRRYLSFVRDATIHADGTSESAETWDMVLPKNSASNAVFCSFGSLKGSSDYLSLSFSLIGAKGMEKALPIQFEAIDAEDAFGEKMPVRVPCARIPTSRNTQRLVVKFKMAFSERRYWVKMQVPKDVPVDYAKLALHTEPNETINNESENSGFAETRKTPNKDSLTQEFTLKRKWTACGGDSICEPPRVAVSVTSWRRLAEEDGMFYKSELEKKSDLSLNQLGIALPEMGKNSPDSAREIAYRLFNWMGSNFTYLAAPLNFNPKTRFNPKQLEDEFQAKKGDCRDFTLAYIKLLALAGIRAEPVEVELDQLLGPQPIADTIPIDHIFNHIIVYIPDIDEYIDPTTSSRAMYSSGNFAVNSAQFANTYGLHLFSQRFEPIKPGLVNKEIGIDTVIRKKNGVWLGTTTWTGKRSGYQTLAVMLEARDKRIKKDGGLTTPFLKNDLIQFPDSWRIDRDDLHARMKVSFSYQLKKSPTDGDGELLHIPVNIMAEALVKYAAAEDTQTWGGESCFGSEVSEERIEIDGVKDIKLFSELANIHISGIHSEYFQNLSLNGDAFVLTRRFVLDEKRPSCSGLEVTRQKEFYQQIKVANDATHAFR